jgi:hypothetical protein
MANQFEHLFPTTPPATTAPADSTAASAPATTGNQFQHLFPKTPPATITDPALAAADTGNSFWYDTFHPQPADLSRPQTWRDWATKTYSPTASDYGSAALDDVSMGSADYGQAKLTGEDINAIRRRTAASQAALGPMGPVVSAVTYVAGPGKVLGPLAAIGKGAKAGVKAGRAALEGFGAGAISSEGHDLGSDKSQTERATDAVKQGAESAVAGVGGNWIGRGTAKVLQPAFDAAQGAPGRAGDPWFGDMRTASAQGQDISPAVRQFQQDTGHDLSPVLDAQKIGTGPISDLARKGANLTGRVVAGKIQPLTYFSSKPGELGEWAHDSVLNRVRNYATQKAFDQVYPAVAGSPLRGDTGGWTRAIQQGLIGGSLP